MLGHPIAICAVALALAGFPPARLDVVVQVGRPGAPLRTEHGALRCSGTRARATGFLRVHAKPACRLTGSGALQRIIHAQRSQRACSQIYGGPQRARITGRVGNQRIDFAVTRADGCGVSDWQTLLALLGDPNR
jgi:hypothetical protein